ncbi:sugar phosphate isomerase/epimerase [Jeotgalibacillus sp. ET6]|uniref:sugar phosphate isomerase/epimerase family protein n=1 Tax=Jeotgalibacillus sp. ET6 TaxID=3037260 RepID=UPI0024184825|nr:sugar phosphate isomerase/epimerase [Jeotgalibacillus sp. ET6]MDG5472702.1 sugar phosphate isomerase/epimerase [Jeotgalibacillus sp. ET6]
MRKVALQLYSVKEAMEQDVSGTLKTVSEQGYEGVQLAGDYGKSGAEWKTMLDEYGLKPAGMHVPVDLLQDEETLQKQIDFSKTIGNEKLIVPFVDESWRSKDKYEELAQLLNQASTKVQDAGLLLGYHHHDFEFTSLENGETGWSILERETAAHPVHFEIDVYWTEFSGVDTVDMLKRLQDKAFSIHIKDMIVDGTDKKSGSVGAGVLNLKEMVLQSSTDWVVVEQEHFDQEPLQEVGPSATVVKKWLGE